jgi:hypothetical protein
MIGTHALVAELLYGAGLRLMECVRLRIQDVDFGQNILYVRVFGGRPGLNGLFAGLSIELKIRSRALPNNANRLSLLECLHPLQEAATVPEGLQKCVFATQFPQTSPAYIHLQEPFGLL